MPIARLICFSALLCACRESALKLEGQHGTPATALDLPADKNLSGEFNGAEDTVFIRVRLKEPVMLRAELSAARGVDSSLVVFNPPDKLLSESDDNGSSLAEEIAPIYLPAGDSLLRIRGKGGEHAAFTFFYRTFQAPADVEREPNNSTEAANPVSGTRATGFYGPELDRAGSAREREKDCFVKELAIADKKTVNVKLTGVEGILSSLTIRGADGKELMREEASAAGAPLAVGPFHPVGAKFFVCVAAVKTMQKHSRDYYDLTFTFGEAMQKSETEPNNSPQTAGEMLQDQIEGVVSTFTDADFFLFRNRREYPISLRVDLEGTVTSQLALTAVKQGQTAQLIEDSAPKSEVVENIRLEAGETVLLSVKNRAKLKKKNFKPAPYILKLQETQASDENETEPNSAPEKADTLVDLTQKWGFLNPMGDVDYYRLKLPAAAERQLVFESKIDCKIRIEHLRGAKSIAVEKQPQNIRYKAFFENDDLIKVQCLGQKAKPGERAYRIALTEP
jgi:hypothetical protein